MRLEDAEQMGEKGEMPRRAPEELRTATAEDALSDGQSGGQVVKRLGTQHIQECCGCGLVLMFSLWSLLLQYHNPSITSSFAGLCWQKSGQWQQDPAPMIPSWNLSEQLWLNPCLNLLTQHWNTDESSLLSPRTHLDRDATPTQPRSLLDILSCITEMSVTEWFLSLQLCYPNKESNFKSWTYK